METHKYMIRNLIDWILIGISTPILGLSPNYIAITYWAPNKYENGCTKTEIGIWFEQAKRRFQQDFVNNYNNAN